MIATKTTDCFSNGPKNPRPETFCPIAMKYLESDCSTKFLSFVEVTGNIVNFSQGLREF